MGLSLFLAKLWGIYLLILALILLLRRNQFEVAAKEMLGSRGIIAFSGVIALIIGLAIAIAHPVWEWNWKGVITLLGYLAILQGIVRLSFTAQVQRIGHDLIHRYYWGILLFAALLGGYLTYHGFYG